MQKQHDNTVNSNTAAVLDDVALEFQDSGQAVEAALSNVSTLVEKWLRSTESQSEELEQVRKKVLSRNKKLDSREAELAQREQSVQDGLARLEADRRQFEGEQKKLAESLTSQKEQVAGSAAALNEREEQLKKAVADLESARTMFEQTCAQQRQQADSERAGLEKLRDELSTRARGLKETDDRAAAERAQLERDRAELTRLRDEIECGKQSAADYRRKIDENSKEKEAALAQREKDLAAKDRALADRAAELETRQGAVQKAEADLKQRCAQHEQDQTSLQSNLAKFDKTMGEAHKAHESKMAELAQRQSELDKQAVKNAEFRAVLEASQRDFDQLRKQIEQDQAKLEKERKQYKDSLAESGESMSAAQKQLVGAKAEIEQQKQGLAKAQQELQQSKEQIERQRKDMEQAKAAFEAQRSQAGKSMSDLESRQAAVTQEMQSRRAELDELAAELQKQQQELAAARQSLQTQQTELKSRQDAFEEDLLAFEELRESNQLPAPAQASTTSAPVVPADGQAPVQNTGRTAAARAGGANGESAKPADAPAQRQKAESSQARQTVQPHPVEPAEVGSHPAGSAALPEDDPALQDLDPVTVRKLKVLKRVVGPGKSTVELLAILREREGKEEEARSDKKRWWKRG